MSPSLAFFRLKILGIAIDVESLKTRLLQDAETLLAQWLPGGQRDGAEYKCGDLSGNAGNSCSINLRTGKWADFASEEDRGNDLISLYAAIFCGRDNGVALKKLAQHYGMLPATGTHVAPQRPRAGSTKPAKEKPAEDGARWIALPMVPADAPDYKQHWGHYARGLPTKHWEYRNAGGDLLGVICRFDKADGSKDVQPLAYCVHAVTGMRQWRYKAFPEPRPLYGMPELGQRPNATVIVVEGEKCRDALQAALDAGGHTSFSVVTWPGGSKAVSKADFAPLAGRKLILWPDADAQRDKEGALQPLAKQPGFAAMQKVLSLCRAHCPDIGLLDVGEPGERPDGWDCADAIEDGWDRAALLEFIRLNVRRAEQNHFDARAASRGDGGQLPPDDRGGGGEPPERHWREALIYKKNDIVSCVANVVEILINRPEWQGVIAYDEFAQRIVRLKPAPYAQHFIAQQTDEWTDGDDTLTATWLAQNERLICHSAMVMEAVAVVARMRSFHPVRSYLQGLQWDGTARLDSWLEDFLSVARTEYSTRVGRWFLMGMVARVLSPGCKFDYCLVLEGTQGLRKSSALRILGGEWFSDIELDLGNKDAMSNIRGKWLHEFSEMGSIARAESQRQKSFLSRQIDEFRPTYGRREVRNPRQLAFAGSTNEWQWNKDPTGGRRFWPVEVQAEIDITGLQAMRDQLFAEAYARVLAKEQYWPDSEAQREFFDPEQASRETPEAFVELLDRWFGSPTGPVPGESFTLADACTKGLQMDPGKITRDVQTRAGIALRKLGCPRKEHRSSAVRFTYEPPPERLARQAPTQSTQGAPPGDAVPF